MQMTIKSDATDLDTLLDDVVEGVGGNDRYEVRLTGLSAGALMQIYEIAQIEKGEINLAA